LCFTHLLPSRRTEIINLLKHKPFLELLGTSEPDPTTSATGNNNRRASTLPVSLRRKRYEKKIFIAEVCNEETPTLQT
jgi:hypothetical protein